MKQRIKEIRKDNNETQQAFADKLNVSKSTIEAIEYGRREATDRIVSDICRVYQVNEKWLRTGEGEKKAPLTREAELAELTAKLFKDELTPIQQQMIKYVTKMTPSQIEIIRQMAKEMLEMTENEPSD